MPTAREEHALALLPEYEADYQSAYALLDAKLTPGQRLARQGIVRIRLNALNVVRAAAGLTPQAPPHLLSFDELTQPKGRIAPEVFAAAYEAQQRGIAHLQAA